MPKISIGTNDTMFILKPDKHAERGPDSEVHLLISAHGAITPGSFVVPSGLDLHFYGKHGAAVYDPGAYGIMKGKYQVFETTQGNGSTTSSNYVLSKYQETGGETYESLIADLNRNYDALGYMADRTGNTGRNYGYDFDVLTIRNRWHHKLGLQLSTVLQTLALGNHQYDQIHCSFCRWKPFGGSVSAPKFGT